MADTYSNTHIFTSYVKEHFLKYVQSRDSSQPVLLLYDGHCSHISLSLIKWAQENNSLPGKTRYGGMLEPAAFPHPNTMTV
jgi:hypothetical protein